MAAELRVLVFHFSCDDQFERNFAGRGRRPGTILNGMVWYWYGTTSFPSDIKTSRKFGDLLDLVGSIGICARLAFRVSISGIVFT
eukprot:scaffold1605_cov158-Amphora_coffeaeformis.AAC.10